MNLESDIHHTKNDFNLDRFQPERYRNSRHPYWTEEMKSILLELWNDGDIALRDIPRLLFERCGARVTRNGVIGTAHRNNFPKRSSINPGNHTRWGRPPSRVSEEERRRRANEARRRWQINNPDKHLAYQRKYDATQRVRRKDPHARPSTGKPMGPMRIPPCPVDLAIPQDQRKTLLELGPNHCRYPVNDTGTAEFFFCGAELSQTGECYCERHSSVCFRPTPKIDVDKAWQS